MLRIISVLAALMFFARCADQARPMLKTLLGTSGKASGQPAQPAKPGGPSSRAPEATQKRARPLRIATWNLEWLDLPGRGREGRTASDYVVLAEIARELDADIVAVQEVASEAALALVFPPDEYAYHLAQPGRAQLTGFAYRRTLDVTVHPDLTALALDSLRAGADLGVRQGAQELRLLAVHLKAMCTKPPLTKRSDDCQKLAQQVPVLEAWVDARARERVPFAVLGDFNRVISSDRDALWRELDDGDPQGLALRRTSARIEVSCDGKAREAAIDHVVLGGPATQWFAADGFHELVYEPEDIARANLSDHCPIRVDLRVPQAS